MNAHAVWSPTAEAFVEVLGQAHRAGAPYLRWGQIKSRLDARGFHPTKARDVRRGLPDWDEVIESPRSGVYRLR